MNNTLTDLQSAESKLMLNTYARYPLLLTRGEGVHLYDENNTEYLDLLSGIGVCALGYNHPAITAAINEQAKTLIHTSNLFYHPHTAELALRLTEITGASGSGRTSMLRTLVAAVATGGRWVAYIDATRTLAPRDWAHVGSDRVVGLTDVDNLMAEQHFDIRKHPQATE